jgi:murein DD-endopeptidase MepM/ murein hydrolase activator NlpD
MVSDELAEELGFKMVWRHPFDKSTITSRFGVTANRPTPHRGLDYAPAEGTNIPAVTKGTVRLVQWSDILGWVLVQTAWDQINSKTIFVGYCHLKDKPTLTVGTAIRMGQTIGKVGNTGSASKGAHLHLTIGPSKTSVFTGLVFDPEKIIDQQMSFCTCCKRYDA